MPPRKDTHRAVIEKDPNDRPRFHGIKSHPFFAGLDFDAAKLKDTKIPIEWVHQHVLKESKAKPKSLRRNSTASMANKSKTELSLALLIDDIIAQMMELSLNEDTGHAASRWTAVPSSKTQALFRRWNYISEDALQLEMAAPSRKFSAPISRRYMRRGTQ